jgi:hypothetical protein
MKSKLILVEGIPGSGKSTIAKKIKEYLDTQKIETTLYTEGDAHPADLAWCAYLPKDKYIEIINQVPQYAQVIKDNTRFDNDFAVVAYTKLGLSPSENEIMKCFEAYEVYDGRVTFERFTDLHLKRWKRFSREAENGKSVHVFECAFLQNHVSELMGMYNKEGGAISDYLISLLQTVEMLNPIILYLMQPDVNKTITRIAKERVSSDKSKQSDWIDLIIGWVEKSQYGKKHVLKGFNGVVRFLEERKKIEMEVLSKLPIDHYLIENPDENWEDVFNSIKKILASEKEG